MTDGYEAPQIIDYGDLVELTTKIQGAALACPTS
jgi:hypothetical protein